MAKIDLKKRAERNNKIRRTIGKIEQTVKKLETMKDEYLRRAVDAKARGESASYAIAKNGLNITLTQIKRAREMLLNIEITSELQKMGETNADFLTGMSTIAKSISKINKKSDFVKLQKEIERALSGMEEAQAGLDGFLQNTDAAFAALTSAPGALTDTQIDRLVDGQVSEKELLMDEQLDALLGGMAVKPAASVNEGVRARVGGDDAAPAPRDATLVAKPFPSPTGVFDFSAKPSPAISLDAFRSADCAQAREVALADVIAPTAEPCVILGRNADDEAERIAFSEYPHILVGGMLGSGKSTFLRQAICSLLLTQSAEKLRLVLFDFKREELCAFDGVAHLSANVVTDAAAALPALAAVGAEMNRRYELFASAGVRDIAAYNGTAAQKLPYILVAFDEYADAIDACGKAFESAYTTLARQSAGAGIYSVLCTRNLTQNAVTAGLRANTDAHIAFRTRDAEESRLILGADGAERLSGAGKLLCAAGGAVSCEYDAPHVSAREVDGVAAALKGDAI